MFTEAAGVAYAATFNCLRHAENSSNEALRITISSSCSKRSFHRVISGFKSHISKGFADVGGYRVILNLIKLCDLLSFVGWPFSL